MAYVDGFVIGVPRKKTKSYEKTVRARKKMWMKLKPGETVMFSYILYKSRARRSHQRQNHADDEGESADGHGFRDQADDLRCIEGHPLDLGG
jgi:uncharacterized protein YbaA (DUF1428 family)